MREVNINPDQFFPQNFFPIALFKFFLLNYMHMYEPKHP